MKVHQVKDRINGLRFGKRPTKPEIHIHKKRRLKYIAVLPSFITLMNGALGFIAIVFASRSPEARWSFFFLRDSPISFFVLAGYMIFLAMIADALDGRVARLTRTTSSFGGQLDSLSDIVSFGIAPAFLMIRLVEFHLASLSLQQLKYFGLIERGMFFSAILYAMCAMVRLARFNVENEEDESAHMNFSGLPSPAAAGVVVSIVILQQRFFSSFLGKSIEMFHALQIVTVSALPVITLLAGILMVSRIRYPHVPNQLFRRKKTLAGLLAIFACGLLVVWNIQLAMVIGFCGFAAAGVIRWILVSLFRKARPTHPPSAGIST